MNLFALTILPEFEEEVLKQAAVHNLEINIYNTEGQMLVAAGLDDLDVAGPLQQVNCLQVRVGHDVDFAGLQCRRPDPR